MRNRIWPIAALALLASLILVAVFKGQGALPPSAGYGLFPTSYSTSPAGTRALYMLLRQEGRHPLRWQRPYRYLPSRGFLLVDEPISLSHNARQQLRRFVAAGNGAWLITAQPDLLAKFLGRPPRTVLVGLGTAQPLEPTGPLSGVRRVTVGSLLRLPRWQPDPAVDLLGDGYGAVLAEVPLGKGILYISPDPTPLSNAFLDRADNLQLVLNILGSRPGPILFDEYHHGLGASPLTPGPTKGLPVWAWALLAQGLATVLLAFWMTGKRFGPVVRRRETPVFPWSGEYFLSLARLYQRAGARRHALELLLQPLAKGLQGKSTNPAAAQLVSQVQLALEQGDPPEQEFLRLARRIHDLSKELKL